jgi:hypothetical protein
MTIPDEARSSTGGTPMPVRLILLMTALSQLLLAAGAGASPAQSVGPRLFKSGPIQSSADGRWVWVANMHADSVARIDTRDGSVSTFALPDPVTRDSPRGLSVTESGSEVWVAAHDSDRLYVLNGSHGGLLHTIDLPWGSGPYSIALSPPDSTGHQRWGLATLHRAEALAMIDTTTRQVSILRPVFLAPHGVAWTEDGLSAWVTHLAVDGEHPHITRVDVSGTRPTVATHINAFAATPRHTGQLSNQDASKNVAEGGYLNFRGHPAQVPSRLGVNQLWLPTQYHNMTQDVYSPEASIQVSLRKLDLSTRRFSNNDKIVLTAQHIHDPTRGDNNPPWLGYGWNAHMSGGVDLAFAEIGFKMHALVLGEQSNDLVLFAWDTPPFRSQSSANAAGLPEVSVGQRPMGVTVLPTAPLAYVYNALSFDVSVVDLSNPAQPTVRRSIAIGGPVAADPVSSPTRLRGARLFYTSADPRISANQKVSCASCHINAETDGRHWGFHHLPPGTAGQGHGSRSTPSLLGVGLTHTPGQRDPQHGFGQLHRSGDRDEIQDFEHTFQSPIMGGSGLLGRQANAELGAPNAGRDADLDAMADFLLALPPLMRSPYRAPDGSLTDAALRGATFFKGTDQSARPADAGCARCHSPQTNFTDYGYHDAGGRRDASEQELNDATRRGSCLWCANTPSLVGVWNTPPYEGVWQYPESFGDVLLDFSTPGRPVRHGNTGRLTGRQVADLAEFVLSIDGNMTAAEVAAARDTSPPHITRAEPASLTRVDVWFNESVERTSAEDTTNYRIVDMTSGRSVRVTGARLDTQNGDHVTLDTSLRASAAGYHYRLEASGPIKDLADTASGGTANVINAADPRNVHTFTLTDTLTISLGASGYENLTIPVHDASPVGPNLSTWSFDRVMSSLSGENVVPGFVRFDWQDEFVRVTGVQVPDEIVDARFSLNAIYGDAQPLEIRRTLQAWSDSQGGGDWNQNPVGGPTWRDHEHPNKPWNRPGAGALGGDGRKPSDYNGAYDLTESVDAVVQMQAINERVEFAGPGVTDAFRFWHAYPDLDYGYAVRLHNRPPAQPVVRFERWEGNLRQFGPVLTITYRLWRSVELPPGTATVTSQPPAPTPTLVDRLLWKAYLPAVSRR